MARSKFYEEVAARKKVRERWWNIIGWSLLAVFLLGGLILGIINDPEKAQESSIREEKTSSGQSITVHVTPLAWPTDNFGGRR